MSKYLFKAGFARLINKLISPKSALKRIFPNKKRPRLLNEAVCTAHQKLI